MKKMLVVLMMTGMMLGAHALKCNQCVDIAYDTDNDGIKNIMKTLLGDLAGCSASSNKDCAEEQDECAANFVSYKMEVASNSVAVSMVFRNCSLSAVDDSTLCDQVKSGMGANALFKNVKCKTETCTTDGCNAEKVATGTYNKESHVAPGNQTASASATGLSFSFLLFASIAIAMFY